MARANDEGGWGLIFCGGAMRNAFSAGVAWALWRAGFKGSFFKWVIGISGGSGIAAYFLTDQVIEGRRIWIEEIPKGLVRARWPILDLTFLTQEVFQHRVPLDTHRLHAVSTRFEVVVTNCDNGRAEFIDGQNGNIFDVLKASCALFPFHGPVELGTYKHAIDGGIAGPIPIDRMVEDGVHNILVVLPAPITERAAPVNPLLQWAAKRYLPPHAACAYRLAPSRYNDALLTLRAPTNGTRIVTIAPSTQIPIGRLTTDPRRIEATMAIGNRVMEAAITAAQFP